MMDCLAGGQAGVFAAISRCSHACEKFSPRFTAGTKIVAAGVFIAAPYELLLPASLLSHDVRSFFSRNWQIVKTGEVRGTHALDGTPTDKKISTKQAVLIAAGLLGLAAVGYTVLPFAPNAVAFPLTRKLATAIAGISMPHGAAAFEAMRQVIEKMDQLSPSQKSAVLDFFKWCTDSFDGLSSLDKLQLGITVACLPAWITWKVCQFQEYRERVKAAARQ